LGGHWNLAQHRCVTHLYGISWMIFLLHAKAQSIAVLFFFAPLREI